MNIKWGKILLPLIAFSFFLTGCNDLTDKETPKELTAQEIYLQAEVKLKDSLHAEASELYAKVERLYPYSEWAKKSLLMSSVANHKGGFYEESRLDAERYLDFYPADTNAAYAQYLIALSYYDQIDNVSRDQSVTFKALQAFRTVIERYPDSEYTSPSLLKFDLSLDHLAGAEMEVGRYYLKRGHFGAAISRFRVVVEEFETTSHTPEALHRLVESYLSLGLNANAQTTGAILGYNFQASDWYKDTHVLLTGRGISTEAVNEDSSSWLTKIWRNVTPKKRL
ncbi:outer membrane protein assembly factor BamD [Amylibacter sp.]|nr:outer membrane protein assembly factor BamD [Amylibacter sp.]MDB4081247.1 outer membrane protein assembly factor BamD [Amylibacter sp.]